MGAVGEGVARSLAGARGGVGQAAIDWMAGKWGTVVDTPFRGSAFVHEARKAGIRSPHELRQLAGRYASGTISGADRIRFEHAARRANAAMIDYGRLGPIERDVVRNVVFLYPWTKGATLYAGHFIRE